MSDALLTGLGLVTGYGAGVARYWDGLCRGDVLEPISTARGGTVMRGVSAQPDRGSTGTKAKKNMLLDEALAEALADSSLSGVPASAVVITVGHGPFVEKRDVSDSEQDRLVGPSDWSPSDDWSGTSVFLSHACASTMVGVDLATVWLEAELADVVIIAGSFVLNRYDFIGLTATRALSAEGGVKPFDTERSGTVLGEGAGVAIIESAHHARCRVFERGERISGATSSVVGGHPTSTNSNDVVQLLREILREYDSPDPPYVHAHATGTVQGDRAELAGLEVVAGERGWRDLVTSSHKGAVGHLMHASGFPAIAAARGVLRTGRVPGTPGLTCPEYSQRIRPLSFTQDAGDPTHAVVTSFGFGGNNAGFMLTNV